MDLSVTSVSKLVVCTEEMCL